VDQDFKIMIRINRHHPSSSGFPYVHLLLIDEFQGYHRV